MSNSSAARLAAGGIRISPVDRHLKKERFRADGLALLFCRLHIEAEEFEWRIAIDPAVPSIRTEQNDVIGLVGDVAVLFAILIVQGHLAGAADDLNNITMLWSLV